MTAKLAVGDRVAYSRDFLRSMDWVDAKNMRGEVRAVRQTPNYTLVHIHWDGGNESNAIITNLRKIS